MSLGSAFSKLVTDSDPPRPLDPRVDAEGDLAVHVEAAVALDEPGRVEAGAPVPGVPRLHRAAPPGPAAAQPRPPPLEPPVLPRVLLVRLAAVEVEEHPEAPRV